MFISDFLFWFWLLNSTFFSVLIQKNTQFNAWDVGKNSGFTSLTCQRPWCRWFFRGLSRENTLMEVKKQFQPEKSTENLNVIKENRIHFKFKWLLGFYLLIFLWREKLARSGGVEKYKNVVNDRNTSRLNGSERNCSSAIVNQVTAGPGNYFDCRGFSTLLGF